MDRVPGYEPVGRRFESCVARQKASAPADAFLILFFRTANVRQRLRQYPKRHCRPPEHIRDLSTVKALIPPSTISHRPPLSCLQGRFLPDVKYPHFSKILKIFRGKVQISSKPQLQGHFHPKHPCKYEIMTDFFFVPAFSPLDFYRSPLGHCPSSAVLK